MRLGVLSNQNLNPWINWTTLGPPLLNSIAIQDGAVLIAPPAISWQTGKEWLEVAKKTGSTDTLFWMQGCARPELPLLIASMLRGRARRSNFVVDAWRQDIAKIGAMATLQRLNPCFVAFREGYLDLRKQFPKGTFEWLPFGVDTDVFDAVPGERPIFAYWMGRRYEALHTALLNYCRERGLVYRYTMRPGEFSNPYELGRIVGSAQYFIVAPPDLGDPSRTGGYSPFVMRYLEGLAAGARLLGVLPGSGEYERLLPLDAMLAVAPDGSDLAAKLDADRNDLTAAAAVDTARKYVRQHHSWQRRAEQIFNRLAHDTPTGFDQ